MTNKIHCLGWRTTVARLIWNMLVIYEVMEERLSI